MFEFEYAEFDRLLVFNVDLRVRFDVQFKDDVPDYETLEIRSCDVINVVIGLEKTQLRQFQIDVIQKWWIDEIYADHRFEEFIKAIDDEFKKQGISAWELEGQAV